MHARQLLDEVWVLDAHVFRVAAEDLDRAVLEEVDLVATNERRQREVWEDDIPELALHRTCTRM